MAYVKKPTRLSKQKTGAHLELQKTLIRRLMVLVGIVLSLIIVVGFFSPTIGWFFGLLAKKDNGPDLNTFKPNTPLLVSIPEATKEDTVNIQGYAQPGMTIKIFVNGKQPQTNTVGADGIFTFNELPLDSGRNVIYAKAADSAGNESDDSTRYILYQDKEKPDLDIESPKDGDTIKNLDKRIKIEGKVNEKAEVKVNERLAIVKPDLTFEFLLGVEEGDVKIKVTATDLAGNETAREFRVNYQKDN